MRDLRTLYLDLELSQREDDALGWEIIQIGIVEADFRSLAITRKRGWYVRPEADYVHPKATELTGITSDYLRRHGQKLRFVLPAINKEYGPANKTTFTWGDDKSPIEDECSRKGITNPFRGPFVDLGTQFRLLYGCPSIGLNRAVETLGMTFEGRQHHALDDAFNTARVHLDLVRRARDTAPPLIQAHAFS